MPFSPSFLFIYTPLPWTVILCLVLYRHNLSQLFHPVKERSSTRDWKHIFEYLEIPIDQSPDFKEYKKNKVRAILEDISEIYPGIKFYASVIASISISSILASAVASKVSLSFSSHLTFLLTAGLQLVSAVPSIFAMQRFFGSFPSPPHKFHLKKNRMGSLLRYAEPLN